MFVLTDFDQRVWTVECDAGDQQKHCCAFAVNNFERLFFSMHQKQLLVNTLNSPRKKNYLVGGIKRAIFRKHKLLNAITLRQIWSSKGKFTERLYFV